MGEQLAGFCARTRSRSNSCGVSVHGLSADETDRFSRSI